MNRKIDKDLLEDIMCDAFVWFFATGGVFLALALVSWLVFENISAAIILVSIWVAVWVLCFVLFLARPYIRWTASRITKVLNKSF